MLDKNLKPYFPGKPRFVNSINADYKREIDDKLIEKLISFTKSSLDNLSQIGLTKVVVGFSGGIDSAVSCILLKRTLGEKAIAVVVDFEKNKGYSKDTKLSLKILEQIGIKYKVIKGTNVLREHFRLIKSEYSISRIHLKTRIINNLIFQFADNESAAVVDTGDRSEELLGRYAECFYGHLAPLAGLYKTELYDLAKILKIPKEALLKQPGCPDLLDIDAFGVGWEIIDPLLFLLVEKKYTVEKTAEDYRIDKVWLSRFKRRINVQPYRTKTVKLLL